LTDKPNRLSFLSSDPTGELAIGDDWKEEGRAACVGEGQAAQDMALTDQCFVLELPIEIITPMIRSPLGLLSGRLSKNFTLPRYSALT
jgi:hypothetical protein